MILNSESTRIEERLTRWKTAAKEAGVKLTHQRLEIFRELAGSEAHPDAETLFRAVRERVPTVSVDTVYRTLWLLHDLGLVATLGPRREAIRFDVNLDRHHHFVCVRCGLVRDVQSGELDAVRVPDSVREIGVVLEARVEVRGVCATCQHGPEHSRTNDTTPDHDGRNEP